LDIVAGDAVINATPGYIKKCVAGDKPVGIAMQDAASPAADGDVSCLIDVSPLAQYEYPPAAGSVTQALANTKMDLGGAQSIDTAAVVDQIFTVDEVDTVANTVLGRFTFTPL